MSIFASHRAQRRLEAELIELRASVHNLETANKRLGLEWEELYDKVRHQMSRMSRRAAVDEKELANLDEPEIGGGGPRGVDSISAGIHRRRASNVAKP